MNILLFIHNYLIRVIYIKKYNKFLEENKNIIIVRFLPS